MKRIVFPIGLSVVGVIVIVGLTWAARWALNRALIANGGLSSSRWSLVPDPGPPTGTAPAHAERFTIPTSAGSDTSIEMLQGGGHWAAENRRFLLLKTQTAERQFQSLAVWDLLTGKRLYTIDKCPGWSSVKMVGPGASYLVGSHHSDAGRQVVVYFAADQKILRHNNPEHAREGPFFAGCSRTLLPGDRVLSTWCEIEVTTMPGGGTKYSDTGPGKVVVWDLHTGATLSRFQVPSAQFSEGAVSAGGRYLACPTERGLLIYELATAKLAAQIPYPTPLGQGKTYYYPGCHFWFSPDGQLLIGGFFEHNEQLEDRPGRLVCWDCASGKVVQDATLTELREPYRQEPLDWFGPDSSTCVVSERTARRLIERQSGRVLWSWRLEEKGVTAPQWNVVRALEEKVLVAGYRQPNGTLVFQLFDLWNDRLQRSLQSLRSQAPARLRPGMSVGLHLDVGETRFSDRGETEQTLRVRLTRRLAELGFTVAPGRNPVFSLQYRETAGKELVGTGETYDLFGNMVKPKGRSNKGQRVQVTNTTANAAWFTASANAPLWSRELANDPRWLKLDLKESNAAGARRVIFEEMVRRLEHMEVPYFLPEAQDVDSLPGTTIVVP